MYFPTSGVEVAPIIPVISAFGISLFCSMSGISGAFLLLPFQISVLGYVQPGVSATNQIFNILACPAGVWRYAREGRLLIPLAMFIAAGTLPGVFIGAFMRLTLLSNITYFLYFVSFVLFYLGGRMLFNKKASQNKTSKDTSSSQSKVNPCLILSKSLRGFSFSFNDESFYVSGIKLMILSLIVGLVGGIYGIGGGAIMVPFLVSFFGLPVHAIAGAALFATFLTSIAGVLFYSILAFFWKYPWAAPDWGLGILLGIGGIMGMYLGASFQKYVSPKILRFFLLLIVFFMGFHYLFKAWNS